MAGYAPVRTGASTTGRDQRRSALYAFDTVDLGREWQVNGGLRVEHYDTTFRTVDAAGVATADLGSSDVIMSGKAGVLYKASATGNVYVSVGTSVTPPGTANFTLSAQPNNQNNPNVEPQESTNYEVGAKWDVAGGRLSLNAAVFRTENRNVIFTVDATTIPPLYNQDDSQRVNGLSLGTIGRINGDWDVFANFAYLDSSLETQNDANSGNRLTLTPKFSGSVWTTYRLPETSPSAAASARTDEVFINAANTIKSPGYYARRRPGRVRGQPEPHAPAEPEQPDRRRLHPERQQQRRPLQPRPAAGGDPDVERHSSKHGARRDVMPARFPMCSPPSRSRMRATSSAAPSGPMAGSPPAISPRASSTTCSCRRSIRRRGRLAR